MLSLSNPVEGPHIGPLGHLDGQRGPTITPPSDHRLPRGTWCFRVTQTFDNPDFYWVNHGRPDAKHNALDLGNHTCGEKVLAMAAGKAYAGIDSAGALYVIIDHGGGWLTRYWHLAAWVAPVRRGVWVAVRDRQQVGVVGDTGLGAVCHLHIELVYNGVRRDPWPLLTRQEAGMFFGSGDYDHYPARATCKQGARLRTQPSTKIGEVLATYSEGTVVQVYARARGPKTEAITGGEWWYLVSAWVDGRGYVDGAWMHQITFSDISPVASPDDALQRRIRRAKTALGGVPGAIEAANSSIGTVGSAVSTALKELER